jgi:hypothetical protein
MPFKVRMESITLKILRILNKRMVLAEETQKYYLYLEKGYLGEVQFDALTEKLECDCLVLNDLELEIDNTKFQIDTLIIYQDLLYMIEVKNYEGDYCYDPDSFTTKSGTVLKNPLDQLKRSKTLLRQMCQRNGITLAIEAYVVFVNPAFTLYQAPKNLPFIFPTQLSRFLEKLNSKSSILTIWHTKFADHLVSLHNNKLYHDQIPYYEYEHVKKGITCKACNSFSLTLPSRNMRIVCSECGCKELVEVAVLRSLEEYKLLFPDRKITTRAIHDWCQVVQLKRIQSILSRNYKKIQVHRWSFYE